MTCHECGESLSADAKFCSSCGAKVKIIAPVIEAATSVGTDVVVAETTADTAKRYAIPENRAIAGIQKRDRFGSASPGTAKPCSSSRQPR